jgi:hypothetical protein
MSANFMDRMTFQMNKNKILSLFPEGKKTELRFTDIKNLTGFNQRKTNDLLKSLVEDGFIGKKKIDKRPVYYNKFSTYRGNFDVWDLMSKIDRISNKNGKIIKEDIGFMSGLCSVLAYGCPPYEKLTHLERDMIFQILNNLRVNFINFKGIVDGIEFRRRLEKKRKLPDDCKNVMFGEDSGDIDYASVDKIYGDALWNYIFNHYNGIFHFQLTKGYMDIHGLIDLFNILNKVSETIDVEVKNKGPFVSHDFPPTTLSRKIPDRFDFFGGDTVKDNAFGFMVTPSPRVLTEYCDQVGWIIRTQVDVWKDIENFGKNIKTKKCDWNSTIPNFPDDYKRTRKELLARSIIEDLIPRNRLSKDERKLMLSDPLLGEIFSKDKIIGIEKKIDELREKLVYFCNKKWSGKNIKAFQQDPKWFTEYEIREYRPIGNFVCDIEFQDDLKDIKKHPKTNVVEPEKMIDSANRLEEMKKEKAKEFAKTKQSESTG